MPVTLAQASQNAQTDLDTAVIDEFRTNSILDLMTFDDAVNPSGGGNTLTYGYRRLITAPTAAFRAINSEYVPQEVTTQQFTTELKPLGGSFQIDRVLANVGTAASGEVALQTAQKIKAAQAKFGEAVILGDSAVDEDSFDGLSKALTGSSTEDSTARNWSGLMTQALAFQILTDVDDLLSTLDGEAGALIGNRRTIQLIKAASRFANQNVQIVGPRDTTIDTYAGARLVDAGFKAGSAAPIIPITAKKSDLYAVRFALDGCHGVSVAGGSVVSYYAPDFSTPGAVKTGEVELGPVGVALKKTKAAGVFRGIQVEV
ncbi:major capsid protein [Glutamicibacter sp. NPDC087344]|uniref:major capsid protein n=1 Tax=Glutamicibacter sp. NPDC087344 TaxID=3363994 RepID=UPI0037F3137B